MRMAIDTFDRRARLLRALSGEPADRPPVLCTGGSMSAVPAEVVDASGFQLPAAHVDPAAMAGLALAAARITGFECVGVPLCATVEAEALGVEVDLGDAHTEARIVREPFASAAEVRLPLLAEALESVRARSCVEAIRILAATSGDLPIFANLVGPSSLAASLVKPTAFLRETRTNPRAVQGAAEAVTDFLISWGERLAEAGADAVAIHEDTATPAIIGPRAFARDVLPHLIRLVAALRARGARVVLHMCGPLGSAAAAVASLGLDGFVPDAALALRKLARELPEVPLIGNVGTFLLHLGKPQSIAEISRRLVREGVVAALSPACGMSSATPLANIRAMTEAVKNCPVVREEKPHV
jgi:[methyl-Co(III) methanol-specific corrinoid protein]:coenzyme M methyltransferase